MDARSGPSREECVFSMEQSPNYVKKKGAENKLKMEECASSMGQRTRRNYAAVRAAQNKLKREGCA